MDITSLSTFAMISLLGAMSPGPDFAIITKNCLTGTFRTGVMTTLGVTTAMMVHISYCVLGIAYIIAESPMLFSVITYLGAAYLFYLGVMLLKEKKSSSPEGSSKELNALAKKKHNPFISGFLCNILNPKATLFVLSVFTQFIHPDMSILQKYLVGSIMAWAGLVWFIFLSYFITHRLLQKHFAKVQFYICKTMGVALCGLALYVAFFSKVPQLA